MPKQKPLTEQQEKIIKLLNPASIEDLWVPPDGPITPMIAQILINQFLHGRIPYKHEANPKDRQDADS